MRRRWLQAAFIAAALLLAVAAIVASVLVPIIVLLHKDDKSLYRWSEIGQALSPIGIFFSGIAFIGIGLTLFLQSRDLRHQREVVNLTREEQRRSSEISLRQLHTDLIKMAIEDRELLGVWPQISRGVDETKKDHYCNLILNLQKVAYEAGTIELDELRGALRYLMNSRDMYIFWEKARAARVAVTAGDVAEDFFTAEIDAAFSAISPPKARSLPEVLNSAMRQWLTERKSRNQTLRKDR